MRREQSVLSNLDAAMRRLSKGGAQTADVMARMTKASEASKSRLANLGAAYASASANSNALVATQKEASTGTKALDNAMKTAAGGGILSAALEKIAEKNPKLARIIRTVQLIGNAAITAGKAAVNFGISVAKLSLKSIELAQADAITYEGLLHSESAAAALNKRVTGLADTYGVATKDLGGFAAQLIKAGIRGTDLTTTLKGLAIRQAAIGDASDVLPHLIEQYKEGGRTAKGFAAEQERMFGPAALKRGKTFDASIERIKRRFGELLSSPAMTKGFDAVFGKIESFLASPAAADFASKITNTVGKAMQSLPGLIDGATSALGGLASAFTTIAGIVGPLAKGIADFAGGLGRLLSGNVSTQEAADAASAGGEALGGKKMQFLADRMREAGNDAGVALGDGVAAGIASRTAVVSASAAALSSAAEMAVRSALEIHSPSRVFARLGAQTAEGFAAGVNDNAAPQAAIGSMVQAPRTAPGARAGVSRSITVHIGSINGVANAEHAAELIEAQLADVLEAAALAGGSEAA